MSDEVTQNRLQQVSVERLGEILQDVWVNSCDLQCQHGNSDYSDSISDEYSDSDVDSLIENEAENIQEDAIEKIREFRNLDVIGHDFLIRHLKSQMGACLNNQKCRVVGFDHNNTWDGRYHCQILTGEKKNKTYKLKLNNLAEYASKALTVIPQPSSEDLIEPKDFLIHMIMAYSSYRYEHPFPKIANHECDYISPDAEGRAMLVSRFVVHHLGLDEFIDNGFESDGYFSIQGMSERANLVELVDHLEKWIPEFFDVTRFGALDCIMYYTQMKGIVVRASNDPEKLRRWQEKDMQSDTSIEKTKRRLCKALEITLYYMICFLHIKPNQRGRADLATYHKTLETMMRIDITKPLECGKVIGNDIPVLFQSPYSCDDPKTDFYYKHHLATQNACYGDKFVEFKRFNFGLTGGSILPDCYLCSEKIRRKDLRIAKLDCHHIFHRKCVTDLWTGKDSKRCPICQEKHFFAESYDLSEQLHNRFFRFIINGQCERCLSFIDERKDYTLFNNMFGNDLSSL